MTLMHRMWKIEFFSKTLFFFVKFTLIQHFHFFKYNFTNFTHDYKSYWLIRWQRFTSWMIKLVEWHEFEKVSILHFFKTHTNLLFFHAHSSFDFNFQNSISISKLTTLSYIMSIDNMTNFHKLNRKTHEVSFCWFFAHSVLRTHILNFERLTSNIRFSSVFIQSFWNFVHVNIVCQY